MRNKLLVITLVVILSLVGFCFYLRANYVVPILMYHRINQQKDMPLLNVSPESFRWQMRFLKEHNYKIENIKFRDIIAFPLSGGLIGKQIIPSISLLMNFLLWSDNKINKLCHILKIQKL